MNAAITEVQQLSLAATAGGAEGRQNTEHAKSVVDSLRERLKNTTKDFKDVLTSRTQNLKQHQERRQLFSNRYVLPSCPHALGP